MDIKKLESTLQAIANLNNNKTTHSMIEECIFLLGAEDLESDLIDVVNLHIGRKELPPQKAAETLAGMIPDVLSHLTWQPQSVKKAVKSNAETLQHLAG